ncbi:MAG: hypothetical protein QNL91_01990, partial [Candidatus Krumholzibacteria bacterium]|nr:hypothetical protein [Candidatus Krumholzibacteria bacterium]
MLGYPPECPRTTAGEFIERQNCVAIRRTRELIWTTDRPSRRQLRQDGYHVLDFQKIRRRVAASRQTGSARSSLGNPAEWVLAVFRRQARVAVLGVECGSAEELRVIYGYLVEPAFRWGCALLVAADRSLPELPDEVDPQWRYPWAKERLQHLAELAAQPCSLTVALPVNCWRRWWWRLSRGGDTEARVSRLDAEQDAAV